jgi:hypothetical protein
MRQIGMHFGPRRGLIHIQLRLPFDDYFAGYNAELLGL